MSIPEEKLSSLPNSPGVYRHLDENGNVIYVGKAKNLRTRVRSYFQSGRQLDGRLRIMVSKIADVDVFVTETEAEALILENNLIKEHKPRYNINLRDDKSYPYVCIKNERFPRVFPTRRVKKDGSRYYGPFTNVKNLRFVLRTIRTIFKLRTCSLYLAPEPIAAGKYQACLEYHINKCAAPCVGLQSEEEYNKTLRHVEKLLNGKTGELIATLRAEMKEASAEMRFEEAASLRDKISAIEKYTTKQRVVSANEDDRDLFALVVAEDLKMAAGVIFNVREGKVIGKQQKYLRGVEGLPESELMQTLVERFYTEATFYPDEVLLSHPLADPEPLEEFLRAQRGKKVVVRVPERGDKAALIRIAATNAELLLEEYRAQKKKQEEDAVPHALKALQEDLRLPTLPRRIECFDISHLSGTGTVASCVVFEKGKPRKSDYRTYKIRSVDEGQADDFKSMKEVIARRYRRVLEENGPWPDLVVVDGGKGQLSSAVEALESVDVYGKFPVVGLAKRLEEVFFPRDKDPVLIPKASASLQLLQRIRNEAHRFAITFQRKQRKKSSLHTELLDVPGIGDKTARKLIQEFGSTQAVRHASPEAIAGVAGPSAAGKITEYFKAKEQLPPIDD